MGKKALLVADDDKNRLESVKALLQSKGHIVHAAGTGKEALERSQDESYNLALLASSLVDKEGPEFVTRMRKLIPRTNTIVIAGDSSSKDAGSSPDLGLEGYAIGPSDPENLLRLVEEKLKEQAEVELYRSVIPWVKP